MQASLHVLNEISIPTACHVSWEGMRGDERARFCSVCNQTVHNLSSLSSSDAAAFITSEGNSACIRFYRRLDGTVITRDCHDNRTSRKGRFLRRVLLAFASWLGLTFFGGCYKCHQGKIKSNQPVREAKAEEQKQNK